MVFVYRFGDGGAADGGEAGGGAVAVLFALALFLFSYYFTRELFAFSERLSIFALVVNKIIVVDVFQWLALAACYAGVIFVCLLVTSPITGIALGELATDYMTQLVLVGIMSEPHDAHYSVVDARAPASTMWIVLYFLFVILTAVVLVNLLYETVLSELSGDCHPPQALTTPCPTTGSR